MVKSITGCDSGLEDSATYQIDLERACGYCQTGDMRDADHFSNTASSPVASLFGAIFLARAQGCSPGRTQSAIPWGASPTRGEERFLDGYSLGGRAGDAYLSTKKRTRQGYAQIADVVR